jgi:Asp-tRNAAsn/Glu-tRNAGln amidotransferase A subunit and related amidases
VLLFEFKDGLDKYFASLGDDALVKSMQHLAELTKANPIETELVDRDLIFQAAEKTGLDSEEFKNALERMLKYSRQEGIDKVMKEHNLDAIVSPTGSPAWTSDLVNGDNYSISSSSPSARAGYPVITVPMGYIDELPVGISFFGSAWSEPVLLEVAYSFEQATMQRRPPTFKD